MVSPLIKIMYKPPLVDEDGIAHVIFTILSKDEERKYAVEAKNGKFYHSCTRKVRYTKSGKLNS